MIACRSFFRFDRLWSLSGPRFPFQGVLFDQAISVPRMIKAKDGPNSINRRKKRNLATWIPISTQSGTKVAGTSFSSSPRSADCDSLSEATSTFSSSEAENLSVTHGHIAVSSVRQQVEVIKEYMHDSNSNCDTELASEVEKYLVSVEVGGSLIRFIKGKGGSTQKQIEEETGVKITFPSSKKDNHIVIKGATEESVTKASEKIASVLEEAVKSPSLDYSHFISFPLAVHPELVDKLQKFQNAILGCNVSSEHGNLDSESNEETSDNSDEENKALAIKLEVENDKEHVKLKIDTAGANSNANRVPSSVLSDIGIDKSIFIKPKTFHLTVLMLKLWNKDRVAAATEVLQKISSQVNEALDNRPVFVKLEGLECMRGSPAKARVLYVPVEEIGGEGRLLRACQIIIRAYVEAGLVLEKDARQALKLHATLMNARHRKRKMKSRGHDSFDARGIFLRYGSEKWGDYLIGEAHLSQRFMFDEYGYYHCCASIPFPQSMQVE